MSPNLLWQWSVYLCSKKLLPAIFLLSLFVAGASHPNRADAQTYAEINNDNYPHLARMSKGSTIPGILGESNYPKVAESEKNLQEFFWKWFFPEMTKPAKLANIREWRDDLNKFFNHARQKKPTDALNQLTLEMMEGIVRGPEVVRIQGEEKEVIRVGQRLFLLDGGEVDANDVQGSSKPSGTDFHPAVKYNAMLVIGELNNWRRRGEAPEPWQPAYQRLLDYAKSPWSDPVRVAALNGLKRYCQVKDRDPRLVVSTMREILAEEGDTDADIWIQRQAVNNLGELAKAGHMDEMVAAALIGLVADEKKPTSLRVAAAIALVPLQEPPEGGATAYARHLGKLALEVSREATVESAGASSGFSKPRLIASLGAPLACLEAFIAANDQEDTSGSLEYAKRIAGAIREMGLAASNSTQGGIALQLEPRIRNLDRLLSEQPAADDTAESDDGDTEGN